eukprot:365253-Chlamydomonas_euryale.AAC.28
MPPARTPQGGWCVAFSRATACAAQLVGMGESPSTFRQDQDTGRCNHAAFLVHFLLLPYSLRCSCGSPSCMQDLSWRPAQRLGPGYRRKLQTSGCPSKMVSLVGLGGLGSHLYGFRTAGTVPGVWNTQRDGGLITVEGLSSSCLGFCELALDAFPAVENDAEHGDIVLR